MKKLISFSMRAALLSACMLTLLSNHLLAQLPAYVPANGLVAWYPFNGNANDESGNGNNGVVNGAVLTADRNGVANSAYYFSGSGCGSRIDADVNTSSIQTGLTISLWLQRIGNGCISPRILEFWPGFEGPGKAQWQWPYGYPNEANYIVFGSATSTNASCFFTLNNPSLTDWIQLTYTNDGSNGRFYYNGVLAGTVPSSGNLLLAGDLALGRMNHPAYDAFNGNMDDMGIWNRALSADEITALYTSQAEPTCNLGTISTPAATICAGESISLVAAPAATTSGCFTPKVKQAGNQNFGITSTHRDAEGNYYVSGAYNGTTTIEGISVPSIGNRDIFLAKYNSCGQIQWVTRGGSSGDQDYAGDGSHGIATDAAGNVYIVGRYNQAFTFYGANATTFSAPWTSTSNGNHQDGFLVKLNSSGQVVWGASLRGTSNDGFVGVAVDGEGNPVVTGGFNGCCPSSFAVTIFGPNGSVGVNSFGINYGSGIVAKFDTNGNILWKAAVYNRDTGLGSLAIDAANNIYLTASFRSWNNGTAAQFIDASGANNSLFNPGIGLAYLVKLNASGNWQWGTTFGNVGDGVGSLTAGADVAVDASGNPWVVGYFRGAQATVYSTNGSNLTIPASTNDIGFLISYSASGAAQSVVTRQQSTGSTYYRSLAIANDKIAIAGHYTGTNAGLNDILLANYTAAGDFIDAQVAGGAGDDYGLSIIPSGSSFAVCGSTAGGFALDGVSITGPCTYLWNLAAGQGQASVSWSTGANTPAISVSPMETTTYTATFSDGTNTCSQEVTVTVNQPSVTAIEATITEGETFDFNGQSLTAAGTYEAVLSNAAGCDSTVTLNLEVSPLPLYCEIEPSATTICSGNSVSLIINGIAESPQDTLLLETISMNMFQPFSYTTTALQPNVNYLLKVYGTVGFAGNIDSQDAAFQYSWFGSPVSPYPFPNESAVWWNVNGTNLIRPTPDVYNPSHIYYFNYTGNGQPLNITWTDSPFSDNSGQLNFALYKISDNVTASYIWSTGETTPSIAVAPTETTTYSVTVTQGDQTCTSDVTITVLPNETYYADADGDGFGNFEMPLTTCDVVIPEGYTLDNTDCNDGDALNYPFASCDDGDPCTIEDVIQLDCTCAGFFADSDEDGTCDANDLCQGGLEPGTPCDDGEPCTVNDVIQSDCFCFGTVLDLDNDGVCDINDACNGAEPGSACDDNDSCTVNDVIQSDCNCTGTFADADNDGTCDANDLCEGLEAGSACDDNDPCTVNDVIQSDCNCTGTFADADNDGTCDANDLCEGSEAGTACDDNDPCTVNDIVLADCTCAGTFADADNDGTCDANDLCEGPEAGTACDDNDPCTVNDIVLADCSCAGTFADADNDGTCDANDLCEGPEAGTACDDNDPCTVNDIIREDCSCVGVYTDSDEDGVCDANDLCAGPEAGAACDDNDPCTINDSVQADCSCLGTLADSDNDGVCDAFDLCFGPEPGSNCDDGNPCTINDVVNEACTCIGEPVAVNTSTTSVTACDSYVWNGAQYTASGTYTFQTTNAAGCDSVATLVLEIRQSSFAPQSVSASSTTITAGQSVTLSVVGGSLGTNAQWMWYSGSCGGTLIGQGASISVSPSSTTTYFVRAVGVCNTTACATVTINVSALPCGPQSITASSTSICAGNAVTLSVTGTLTSGAVWRWYKNGCGLGTSVGTGATIAVIPTATTTYFVRAEGGSCGLTTCLSVAVSVSAVPAKPTVITGPAAALCSQQGVVYSTPQLAGVISYMWTVPSGATIVSGQGTSSITVNFSSSIGPNSTCGYTGICVSALNGCGASMHHCMQVSLTPAAPAGIVASTSVCRFQEATFAVLNPIAGMNYTWEVPNNWQILSGQGTASITAMVGLNNGQVRVYATNACGISKKFSRFVGPINCNRSETALELNLWPNPANDEVKFAHGGVVPEQLDIYDALGREVYSGAWLSDWNVETLEAGIYFVRATSQGESVVKRMEIAH
jgi:hypothetical protein